MSGSLATRLPLLSGDISDWRKAIEILRGLLQRFSEDDSFTLDQFCYFC